jgi:hypothetical protein
VKEENGEKEVARLRKSEEASFGQRTVVVSRGTRKLPKKSGS